MKTLVSTDPFLLGIDVMRISTVTILQDIAKECPDITEQQRRMLWVGAMSVFMGEMATTVGVKNTLAVLETMPEIIQKVAAEIEAEAQRAHTKH
jgi:hypothetical protein